MVDNVIQGKTRKRRQFCSYYTDSDPILTYMVKRLDLREGDIILEPCAGDGVFIEKIISSIPKMNYKIVALDINNKAVHSLRTTFSGYKNIEIQETDTLLDTTLDSYSKINGYFTKVIGNPPYGAWQDYSKRTTLKKSITATYEKHTRYLLKDV